MKQVIIRVEEGMYKELRERVFKEGRSINGVINGLIKGYIGEIEVEGKQVVKEVKQKKMEEMKFRRKSDGMVIVTEWEVDMPIPEQYERIE